MLSEKKLQTNYNMFLFVVYIKYTKELSFTTKERFGNKQLLIDAYVESFINLSTVKSMNQIKELRRV